MDRIRSFDIFQTYVEIARFHIIMKVVQLPAGFSNKVPSRSAGKGNPGGSPSMGRNKLLPVCMMVLAVVSEIELKETIW